MFFFPMMAMMKCYHHSKFMISLQLSKVGTPVGKIEATDLDENRLYYRLISPMVSQRLLIYRKILPLLKVQLD